MKGQSRAQATSSYDWENFSSFQKKAALHMRTRYMNDVNYRSKWHKTKSDFNPTLSLHWKPRSYHPLSCSNKGNMEDTVHVCIHPFKISVSRPRHDIVKRNIHVLYVKFKRMEFVQGGLLWPNKKKAHLFLLQLNKKLLRENQTNTFFGYISDRFIQWNLWKLSPKFIFHLTKCKSFPVVASWNMVNLKD